MVETHHILSKAPLGYVNITVQESSSQRKIEQIIEPDPKKSHFIKQAFTMYLTGEYSVMQINDLLYEKGLRSANEKKVPKTVMFRILKNPFYAGLMRWSGQEKMGNHKPLITMKEYERVQHVMDAHNLHACRRRKHNFLLRGFIICNQCGCRYTAEKHPKKNKSYYHCTSEKDRHSNKGQMIAVDDLEIMIEEQFKRIEFTKEFIEHFREKLKRIYEEQKETINAQKQGLSNQKKALELKRDRAEEKLFGGVLADADFVRLRDKFRGELKVIQNQILELDCQKEYDIDVLYEIIKFTHNCHNVYKTAPYELKRYFLGLFWDKFLVQDKQIITAVPTKLILALEAEKQVIIRDRWHPSPNFIKLFTDVEYLAEMRAKLKEIKRLLRV